MLAMALAVSILHGGQRTLVRAQAEGESLSPEEAILSLAPYLLTTAETPSGYTLAGYTVNTPALLAATQTPMDGDPRATLAQRLSEGFVVQAGQNLVPAPGSAAPAAGTSVYLMADSGSAAALASGATLPPLPSPNLDVETVALGDFAEAHIAWHLIVRLPGQPDTGQYLVRWQRGQLVFAVTIFAPAGDEKADDLLAVLQPYAAKVAALPDLALAAPTVAPPATEAERLEALLKLSTIAIPANDAPLGYRLTSRIPFSVAGQVLGSPDPHAALIQQDLEWQRLVELRTTFTTAQGARGPRLVLSAFQDASAEAATLDINTLVTSANTTLEPIDAPAALGDARAAFHARSVTNGAVSETVYFFWTHGAVGVGVQMSGPEGAIDADELLAFAEQAEAAYQRSAFVAR